MEDIDIFINSGSEIDNYVLEVGTMTISIAFILYLFQNVFELIMSEDDLSEEDLTSLIYLFNSFLNTFEIEEKYEEALRKAGWENNGHQKHWTIFFASIASVHYDLMRDSYKAQARRILEFFNNDDLELINSRMEDLDNSMMSRIENMLNRM